MSVRRFFFQLLFGLPSKFLSMPSPARTIVPPPPAVPTVEQEPQAEHQQWIKSGWMNKCIALCGAIHKRDTDRLLELAQKTLGSLCFLR